MRSGSWHVVVTAEVSVEARLYSWQAGRRGLFITPAITLLHIQDDITKVDESVDGVHQLSGRK